MRNDAFPFLPKDYIQTANGFIFAVVSYEPQDNKIGCFLRYAKSDLGWKKVNTDEANDLLTQHCPAYLYYSEQFDTHFHAVPPQDVIQHFKPESHLSSLLATKTQTDELKQKVHRVMAILQRYGANVSAFGLTGSMLLDFHKATSDIDFAIYGRKQFHQARKALEQALAANELSQLDAQLMQDNYARRAADMNYDVFAWHEYRKFNKGAIEGVKFDLGMVLKPEEQLNADSMVYQKQGTRSLVAIVTNDEHAFDFPARYVIDDEHISEVLSFTHTYVGQAKQGERIEVSGSVEVDLTTGLQRLIVGSSREAEGEYIKVVNT
jgi:hypothetical protein